MTLLWRVGEASRAIVSRSFQTDLVLPPDPAALGQACVVAASLSSLTGATHILAGGRWSDRVDRFSFASDSSGAAGSAGVEGVQRDWGEYPSDGGFDVAAGGGRAGLKALDVARALRYDMISPRSTLAPFLCRFPTRRALTLRSP